MEANVYPTVAVLMVVAVLAGVLIGILPVWRRLMDGAHRLPVRLFLRRQNASLDHRLALQAELRCAVCDAQAGCAEQLKLGAVQPPADCPNSALFAPGRADQSALKNESRSEGRIPAA